jgi:hypothetical protein
MKGECGQGLAVDGGQAAVVLWAISFFTCFYMLWNIQHNFFSPAFDFVFKTFNTPR